MTHNDSRHVLVIENHPDLRYFLADVLFDAGYRVTTVETFAEGRAILRRRATDLVVANVMVSDGPGDRMIGSGIPCVFITGSAEAIHRLRLRGIPYLQKPFRGSQLLAAVEHALEDATTVQVAP